MHVQLHDATNRTTVLGYCLRIATSGAKWSGVGVENGPWGLLGFTEIQVVNVAKS